MKVSIVVPAYNSAQTIGRQLAAVARQTYTHWWEVVVADNGSTDATLNVVRAHQHLLPQLRLVDASRRRGASHARNVGVQAAEGDTILFCDADDEVAPGWLAAMTHSLADHEFVACRYDFEKLNPSWIAKGRGNSQAQGPQRITFLPFLCAGGGSIGVRRAVHESVGGFDEAIRYLEDIDYCQRIQLTGVMLKAVPDALVYCRHPHTLRRIYSQARNWAECEQFLFKRYHHQNGSELWRWRAFFGDNLSYAVLILRLLRSPEGRALAAWRLGRQIGLLKGTLKYRVPPITGY